MSSQDRAAPSVPVVEVGDTSASASFDARLTPHRSLGPQGFLIFMLAIGTVSFGTGMLFLLSGAWPVLCFCGLDVLLVYIAFKLNYRAARLHETVRLTPEALVVRRVQPSPKRQQNKPEQVQQDGCN